MKIIFLIALISVTVSAQLEIVESSTLMRLTWTTNAAADAVSNYRVLVQGPSTNSIVATNPPVDLLAILGTRSNGVYKVNLFAIGESGLESDPSTNLWIYWYGNRPNPPQGRAVEFIPPIPPPPLKTK